MPLHGLTTRFRQQFGVPFELTADKIFQPGLQRCLVQHVYLRRILPCTSPFISTISYPVIVSVFVTIILSLKQRITGHKTKNHYGRTLAIGAIFEQRLRGSGLFQPSWLSGCVISVSTKKPGEIAGLHYDIHCSLIDRHRSLRKGGQEPDSQMARRVLHYWFLSFLCGRSIIEPRLLRQPMLTFGNGDKRCCHRSVFGIPKANPLHHSCQRRSACDPRGRWCVNPVAVARQLTNLCTVGCFILMNSLVTAG